MAHGPCPYRALSLDLLNREREGQRLQRAFPALNIIEKP